MTANPSYPVSFSFDPADPAFLVHEGGKIEVVPTKALRDRADLALLYTPGVAEVSRAIATDPSLAARYTARGNTVAVITDGTAVLGLGDIGPLAALPVMEGKAVLFKHFAGVDAVPVCLETGTVEELVETIVRLAPTYGGINLEDISAPRCFEIERRLRERLDIPVFHDDQHGTAIVVLAALMNAAAVVDKDLATLRVVVQGAGAAGVAVAKIMLLAGIRDVVVCDSRGIISPTRTDLVEHKHRLALPPRTRVVCPVRWGRLWWVRMCSWVCPVGRWPSRTLPVWRRAPSSSPWPTPTLRFTRSSRPGTRRSSPRGVRTSRTRSTTCWPSQGCSGGLSTPALRRSPR